MEDMKSTFKNLFKSKPKAFKGRGHVLGTADHEAGGPPGGAKPATGAPGSRAPVPPQANSGIPQGIPQGKKLGSDPSAAPRISNTRATQNSHQHRPPITGVGSASGVIPIHAEASAASGSSSGQLSTERGFAPPTPSSTSSVPVPTESTPPTTLSTSSVPLPIETAPAPTTSSTSSALLPRERTAPTASGIGSVPLSLERSIAPPPANLHAHSDAVGEELQHAAALFLSGVAEEAPLQLLCRLLQNVLMQPSEPKYRRLRLANPKIQALADLPGGLELLQACGFAIVPEEQDGGEGAQLQVTLLLPEDADLSPLQAALHLLAPPTPSGAVAEGWASSGRDPASAGSNGRGVSSAGLAAPNAAADAVPRPRNTQVLIPVEANVEVPDWVFDRTGAELKASFLASRKRQELEQTLMTRAMREKLMGSAPQRSYKHSTIRVRLPEGLILQGEFNAGEPASAIFEWFHDCLREASSTYELILPSRTALQPAGTVREAGLLPSATLNFRPLVKAAAGLSTLKDLLLREAKILN
eukprot:jgi/Botrbrau1/7964/Bobra.9_2s0116.3